MQKFRLIFFVGWMGIALMNSGCKKDEPIRAPWNGYPAEIGKIIVPTCATSGCHNTESANGAAGLDLTSWESLMSGSSAGAAVIPFRPDQSFLTFFINTNPASGPVLTPTMPVNGTPLHPAEVQLIREWITQGAPDECGYIKFSENAATREKVYVTNQSCDLVAVIDAESRLIMRYVDVGQIPGVNEVPHSVKVSPDKKYWYVIFISGNPYLEIYDAKSDTYVDKIYIGVGDWNTLAISPDGSLGFSVALLGKKIAVIDIQNRILLGVLEMDEATHGVALHPDGGKFYVTQQLGSKLYRMDYSSDPTDPDDVNEIDLIQGINPANGGIPEPHEVIFTPDGTRYLVSCQGSAEVRIFNSANDSLLAVIQVGDQPVEFSLYPAQNLAIVTCMEDTTTFANDPNKRGSVAIIDYMQMTLLTALYSGFQPHGVVVDQKRKVAWISNRNYSIGGPAPHHTTSCGGRNGYMTLIDLITLQMVPGFKTEMSVDPYGVGIRQ